jgi:hypothetical protein
MAILNKQMKEYYTGWLSWKRKSYDTNGKEEIYLRYVSDSKFRIWFLNNADKELIQDITNTAQ